MDKAWRRRSLAVALSIAVHAALGVAFVSIRPARAPEPPPVMVELLPWRAEEPERPQAARKSPAAEAPAQAPSVARAGQPATPLPSGIIASPVAPVAPVAPASPPSDTDFGALARAVIPGWPLGCGDAQLLTRAMRQRCADAGKGRGERQTFVRADGSLRPQPNSRLSAEKEARYDAEAQRKERCIAYREANMPPGLPTDGSGAPSMGYVPSLTQDRCWSMH